MMEAIPLTGAKWYIIVRIILPRIQVYGYLDFIEWRTLAV